MFLQESELFVEETGASEFDQSLDFSELHEAVLEAELEFAEIERHAMLEQYAIEKQHAFNENAMPLMEEGFKKTAKNFYEKVKAKAIAMWQKIKDFFNQLVVKVTSFIMSDKKWLDSVSDKVAALGSKSGDFEVKVYPAALDPAKAFKEAGTAAAKAKSAAEGLLGGQVPSGSGITEKDGKYSLKAGELKASVAEEILGAKEASTQKVQFKQVPAVYNGLKKLAAGAGSLKKLVSLIEAVSKKAEAVFSAKRTEQSEKGGATDKKAQNAKKAIQANSVAGTVIRVTLAETMSSLNSVRTQARGIVSAGINKGGTSGEKKAKETTDAKNESVEWDFEV